MNASLKIGQVAKLAGVGVDTVRFYERERLLPRAARSGTGYRLFAPAIVDRVRFIKQAQGFGLTLTEIGKILRSIDRGEGDRGEGDRGEGARGEGARKSGQRELERVIARIDVKLAELRSMRRKLVGAVADLGSGRCAIERIVQRIAL